MQYTFRTMTGARTQEYRDQQRRAYEANKLARRELKAEAQAKHKTMTEKAADPILVKVIEHHTPAMSDYDDYPRCEGCDPGAYAEDNPAWPCSTINLIEEHLQEEAATAEPTVTDRLLAGEKVAVIGPNLRRSFDFLGDIAEELADAGHNYRITRERLSLDNGGTLEAVTPMGIRGRTLDHVVILGGVDDHYVLPALTAGGTISRR